MRYTYKNLKELYMYDSNIFFGSKLKMELTKETND